MSEPGVFACPACGQALTRESVRYACAQGHHYDLARQGYVNLLPRARRRSSGDSASMLQARRRVFERGHYAPVADGLARLAARNLVAGAAVLLDVGCGEGYYTRVVGDATGLARYGIDIAKPAAAMAARSDPDGQYAVANAYRLPVLPGSVDVALSVFAPVPAGQILRVLAGGGFAVEAIPRPGHMAQIRRLVYAEDREHDEAFSAAEPGRLQVRDRIPVSADLRLSGRDLQDLVMMTPYWHHAPADLHERLSTMDMIVTLDCELRVLAAV